MKIQVCLLGCVLVMLSGMVVSETTAQRLIERDVILNPLAHHTVDIADNERQWFTQTGGWGSFGRYAFSRDDYHLWYQELATYVEIYRRGNHSSLLFTGQIEFIANHDNDINFNPRGIIWEEGFLYSLNRQDYYLQFGYYHRCKHDIDNLRLEEERSLIFGSALARVIVPLSFKTEDDALVSLTLDYYTITWDRREPRELEAISPNMNDLNASLKTNVSWRIPFSPNMDVIPGGYGMISFTENDPLYSGKFLLELATRKGPADFRFGVHVEYLPDHGISAMPQPATLAGFGVRVLTGGSVR